MNNSATRLHTAGFCSPRRKIYCRIMTSTNQNDNPMTQPKFRNSAITISKLTQRPTHNRQENSLKAKSGQKIMKIRQLISRQKRVTELSWFAHSSENTQQIIERVRIMGLYREGNFGKVYYGVLTGAHAMEVAVKKVPIDKAHKTREEYFARVLNSPYIVKFVGTYHTKSSKKLRNAQNLAEVEEDYLHENMRKQQDQQEVLNIIMQKCGNNLHEYLHQQDIPAYRIKILIYQMLRSLVYLHSRGICHRDIKPNNFILKQFRIFLCDFGASKRLEQGSKNVAYMFSREYRAPELLFEHQQYDKSVDIWAIGCVIAEMIAKRPIFCGTSTLDQLVRILQVIGSPKWERISYIKEKIKMLPNIKGCGMQQAIKSKCDPLMIDLVSKMLKIQPRERITALQALCHPYFDELRQEEFYRLHLKQQKYPNLFYFPKKQIFGFEHFLPKLVPFWLKQHCKRFQVSLKNYCF